MYVPTLRSLTVLAAGLFVASAHLGHEHFDGAAVEVGSADPASLTPVELERNPELCA